VSTTGHKGLAERWGSALAAIVVLVVYGVIAGTADSELGSRTGAEAYYNRLIDGFGKGQLSLDLAPPAGLAQLADPYDPVANARFHGEMYSPGRIHDLSYYHGKLYLYFSVIPAVVLFLPFHWLTGAYLSHQQACGLFCGVGFLASAALLGSIRRHCFPLAGWLAATVSTLGVGLIPLVPVVLQRPDVWEVAITASYAFWMLSLLFVWNSCQRPAPSWPTALGLGMTVGLAIGCRPNSCLGASLLLWPLARALGVGPERDRPRNHGAAAALLVPLAGIGAALLAYNYARFGNILEFGQRYQLSGEKVAEGAIRHFDLGFLWFNFRLYFLEYPGWQGAFPFLKELTVSKMPPGYGFVENPVGVLTLLPFILCAAAVPWAIRDLPEGPRRALAAIVGAMLILFIAGAGPIGLYFTSAVRYQLEFIPALVLLAVIGFLALVSRGRRGGWLAVTGAAAAVSIAVNLLTVANLRGEMDARRGMMAMQAGRFDQAIDFCRRALRLQPANVFAQLGLADSFEKEGKFTEAIVEVQRAIVLLPDSPQQRLNYAYCLYRLGRLDEAVAECEAALKLQPDFAAAKHAEEQIRLVQRRGP
jgi:tetratricopeptide (TPR) repeat protein